MTTEKLRVTSIQVRDVLGAREFSMEAGAVTTLTGRNASGKTTAIEAIKSAIGGGSLANLARVGKDNEEIDPEVVLVLEGDSEKYLIEKSAKKTRVRKQVGDSAGFEDVPKPQRWLSGLYDQRLSNPIKFMQAADKDRILMLLGALDVTLDRDALWGSMGIEKKDVGAVPEGLHPLQELTLIREAVFRERTGINRDKKQKEATAEQTRRATPAVLPDDHEEEIEKLDASIVNRNMEIGMKMEQEKLHCDSLISTIQTAAGTDTDRQRSEHFTSAERRRAELEAQIDAEELEIEKAITGKHEIVTQEIHNLETDRDKELEKLRADGRAVVTDQVHLAELREQAKAAIQVRTLHDQAEAFDKEATQLQAMSERLTGAIDAVDEYRRKLADNLPIPGLEVDDKIIKVKGVPFDQLNTQTKIDIAVKIACIRATDNRLPIIWIDGAEALDSENFEALKKALLAEGVQPFIGRVGDDSLSVEVE